MRYNRCMNARLISRRLLALSLSLAVACAALWFATVATTVHAQGPGPIVAVGGGTIDDAIYQRMLALAGGPRAIVAVLPQASATADAGAGAVERWIKTGAAEARKFDFANRAETRAGLERASIIWMPGGSQSRFMQAIAGTGLDEVIRTRHRAGVLVGGTSAGAAVLSTVMITGDADLQNIAAGKTVTSTGLGIWPDVIVDQHFLQRQRGNRLVSAVLDRPTLVGVGIDERTAVIVRGSQFEVIGQSAVVVVDARRGTIPGTAPGAVHAGSNLSLHVLRAGMSWRLN
jgi:cyanophycinase